MDTDKKQHQKVGWLMLKSKGNNQQSDQKNLFQMTIIDNVTGHIFYWKIITGLAEKFRSRNIVIWLIASVTSQCFQNYHLIREHKQHLMKNTTYWKNCNSIYTSVIHIIMGFLAFCLSSSYWFSFFPVSLIYLLILVRKYMVTWNSRKRYY